MSGYGKFDKDFPLLLPLPFSKPPKKRFLCLCLFLFLKHFVINCKYVRFKKKSLLARVAATYARFHRAALTYICILDTCEIWRSFDELYYFAKSCHGLRIKPKSRFFFLLANGRSRTLYVSSRKPHIPSAPTKNFNNFVKDIRIKVCCRSELKLF